MPIIPRQARYEAATKTIRSVPENYWLASMDSWDKAVDHERTALVFSAAFELLDAAQDAADELQCEIDQDPEYTQGIRILAKLKAAIAKAEGCP